MFGLIIAWTLVKYDFPGKKILDGFIELPFCLPTAVAGITLSRLYSEDGFLGKPLKVLGIDVAYTKIGLTIALVFVGIPFVIGIGEYGSVIYISGNSAKEQTQVISYVIMQKLSYIDYASATAIALVMLVISFVLLFAINIVQLRQSRRTNLL